MYETVQLSVTHVNLNIDDLVTIKIFSSFKNVYFQDTVYSKK